MLRRWQEGSVYFVEVDEMTDIDSSKEARSNPRNRELSRQYRSQDDSLYQRQWRSGKSALTKAEVDGILRDGWPEGLERVSRLAAELKAEMPAPKSFKRRGQWREEGDEPSWEREQAGKFNVWRTSRREARVGPVVVKILCPWVHSSSVSADRIVWNGVVLAVLCDLLESAGYRVGATMVNTIGLDDWGKYLCGMVHVKQPSQPLDLASLVPVVAHPAPYRWYGIEWATLAETYCGGGHGSVRSISSIPDVPSKPRDAIVLSTVYTEDDARAEIRRVLALFGQGNPASKHSETEEFIG